MTETRNHHFYSPPRTPIGREDTHGVGRSLLMDALGLPYGVASQVSLSSYRRQASGSVPSLSSVGPPRAYTGERVFADNALDCVSVETQISLMAGIGAGDAVPRVMEDDYGSFADWLAPHVGSLRSYATRAVSREDVEDVLQEALLRAWRHREHFDPGRGSERAWLIGILANECHRHRRRNLQAWPAIAESELTYRQALPDLDLERAIQRLSRRQREVVTLYYFARLTVPEIATVLRCAEGTAKSTLFDARGALRAILEERNA
jgi:RNA polymerase sigma-70 factor (ECF subfamily)